MAIYTYKIGTSATATGTVTVSAGSATVTGSGTDFGSEIVVGDLIIVSDQVRVIATTPSTTSATVTANWSTAASAVAFDYVSFDNVEDLGLPAPQGNAFMPYSRPIRLGDGTVRGLGWPTTTWRFGVLTQAQYDILKAYCSTKSAAVYISTLNQSLAYANYSAVMVWPDQDTRRTGRALDVVVTFQKLVEV